MTAQSKSSSSNSDTKRKAFWRSSVYEEPTWVSLAWIIAPMLIASVAIYFVLR